MLSSENYLRLSDEHWADLSPERRLTQGTRMGCPTTCCRFIDAVMWMLGVGGQWRFLPGEHGNWHTVFKGYSGWNTAGVWERVYLRQQRLKGWA